MEVNFSSHRIMLNAPRLAHGHSVKGLSFFDRGTRLVSSSWGNSSVWDVGTGAEIIRIPDGEVESFAASTEFWATGLMSGHVRIRELSSGRTVREFKASDGHVSALAFAADARCLAGGGRGVIRIWDTQSGKLIHTLNGIENRVGAVSFSPTAPILASVSENFRVWDITTQRQIIATPEKDWPYLAVAFSPDGKFVAFGGFEFECWDLARKKCLFRDFLRTDGLCFTPDGTRLVVGSTEGLMIWNIAGRELERTVESEVFGPVALTPDGALCAFGQRNQIVIVDMVKYESRGTSFRLESSVFWDAERVVSVGTDKCMRVWNTRGLELDSFDFQTADHLAAATPGGLIASSDENGSTTTVFDLSARRTVRTVLGSLASISPSGKLLATTHEKSVCVYHIPSGDCTHVFHVGGEWSMRSVTISADDRFLAAGTNADVVRLWHLEQDEPPLTLEGQEKAVSGLAFSTDGAMLVACADDDRVLIWSPLSSKRPSRVLHCPEIDGGERNWATAIAFISNDQVLVCGTLDGYLLGWDVKTSQLLFRVAAHQWRTNQLSVSTCGTMLVSSSYDGAAIIWNVRELLQDKRCQEPF